MKGVSAVIATILMLLITIALAGMAYMYISGVFGGRTRNLSLMDAWCSGTAVTAIIRNDGVDTIRAAEQSFVNVSNTCSTPTTNQRNDITAGNVTTYTFSGCSGGPRYNKVRLIGPGNSVEISVYCS